jgi:hypothetical protein
MIILTIWPLFALICLGGVLRARVPGCRVLAGGRAFELLRLVSGTAAFKSCGRPRARPGSFAPRAWRSDHPIGRCCGFDALARIQTDAGGAVRTVAAGGCAV